MAQWKKVALFLGSARDGRLGERVATFVKKHLKARNLEIVYFGLFIQYNK